MSARSPTGARTLEPPDTSRRATSWSGPAWFARRRTNPSSASAGSPTQTPRAGEEHRRGWHPERFERAANADEAVLVVGAGPAGMECAVALGKRGFEAVHLVEAEPDIGGRLRWVRRLPTLGDWGRIVDWRRIQLEKLENVPVVTRRRPTAQ